MKIILKRYSLYTQEREGKGREKQTSKVYLFFSSLKQILRRVWRRMERYILIIGSLLPMGAGTLSIFEAIIVISPGTERISPLSQAQVLKRSGEIPLLQRQCSAWSTCSPGWCTSVYLG
jgi:hypothetical protein